MVVARLIAAPSTELSKSNCADPDLHGICHMENVEHQILTWERWKPGILTWETQKPHSHMEKSQRKRVADFCWDHYGVVIRKITVSRCVYRNALC